MMRERLERFAIRLLGLGESLRNRLRGRLLRRNLGSCGRSFRFSPSDSIANARQIFVGDDVYIAHGAVISVVADARLVLGDGVMIGPRLTLMAGDHDFANVGKELRHCHRGINEGQIELERDVWCGACVTILKQVNIGEGCIVGAGSLVSKSLPPYTICVGSPCRPVRLRFNDHELAEHLKLLGRPADYVECMLRRRRQMLLPWKDSQQFRGLFAEEGCEEAKQ